jgi:methylglyoxal synthase
MELSPLHMPKRKRIALIAHDNRKPWDPLEPHPHDVDVKALLRIAVVYNVPIACNRASADFMLSSPLMEEEYDRLIPGGPEPPDDV